MTDIVDQLRAYDRGCVNRHPLFENAADEIERLRVLLGNEKTFHHLTKTISQVQVETILKLRADLNRLKKVVSST